MKHPLLTHGVASLAALGTLVILSGCTKEPVPVPDQNYTYEADTAEQSTDAQSSSSEEVVVEETVVHTITLVDQSFEGVNDHSGLDKLRAMKTVRLIGDVTKAYIKVTLSRNGQNEGIAGVFAFAADLDENGDIGAGAWNRFKALDAHWKGSCARHLADDSSLVSGKGETTKRQYDLSEIPFSTGDDGCSDEVQMYNFVDDIVDSGMVLGFMPSNPGYHLKVELSYEGDLVVTPL